MGMTEMPAGYSASAIEDLPQIWDGWGKLVRAGLGITAFGVQIMDFPAGHVTRSHDEAATGQEELYMALSGSGEVLIGDEPDSAEPLALDPDHLVRVGPGVSRILRAGPDGIRVLCVGGIPGRPYTPPDWTDSGEAG